MEDLNVLTLSIRKLLKAKKSLPVQFHGDIDKLIRKLTNKISEI
tara:strand:- start:347 stop:478 length:132 start_codon:yes stop_codon:yes gene_type:complete